MYIGGTDERALHHLAAEVLDNSMDEAVAGHASRIEVTLEAGNRLTITDNGRGIPIDEHPKYPGKSALEVILTMLHSGGKFSDKAYATSGGLHGVGVIVVNALSSDTDGRGRAQQQLYRQTFSRGAADLDAGVASGRPRTGAAPPSPSPPTPRFSARTRRFKPARLYRLARSKAYLFAGVEIRWHCDPALISDETPAEAVFQFPGGLADHLREQIGDTRDRDHRALHRPARFPERPGLGRMGGRLAALGRRQRLLLLQHHPDAGRRHPRAGAARRR